MSVFPCRRQQDEATIRRKRESASKIWKLGLAPVAMAQTASPPPFANTRTFLPNNNNRRPRCLDPAP